MDELEAQEIRRTILRDIEEPGFELDHSDFSVFGCDRHTLSTLMQRDASLTDFHDFFEAEGYNTEAAASLAADHKFRNLSRRGKKNLLARYI